MDEEGGTEIGKEFHQVLARNNDADKLNKGYFLRICQKNFGKAYHRLVELMTDVSEEIKKNKEQNTDYQYLWSKDGTQDKTDKLLYYLITHNDQHNNFYQGSVMKSLMRKEFLK